MYVITGLQETHQEFDRYGKAKKLSSRSRCNGLMKISGSGCKVPLLVN
nr:Uncharacterised protein [Klebsiella pneumoniae]